MQRTPTDVESHERPTAETLKLLRRGETAPRRSLVSPAELAASRTAQADVSGMTDRGNVRKKNEDQFLVAELDRSMWIQQSSFPAEDGLTITGTPQGRLLMVADGIGGHAGGEVASAVTIDALAYYAFTVMPWMLTASHTSRSELVEGMRQAVAEAQDRVRRVAERKGLDGRLGTTLTIAYITWPEMYVLHAGDSRCYVVRDGKLERITRDHTVAQDLVDRNAMSEEEAERSRFNHLLSNAVGGGTDELTVEVHQLTLRTGNIVLLCTDGLTGHLSDERLAEHLRTSKRASQAVHALIDEAKREGGKDNITAIVARF